MKDKGYKLLLLKVDCHSIRDIRPRSKPKLIADAKEQVEVYFCKLWGWVLLLLITNYNQLLMYGLYNAQLTELKDEKH
jgi:hypothetical protein